LPVKSSWTWPTPRPGPDVVPRECGLRIHGATCARSAELFAECEAAALLPGPDPYVPIFTRVKVHRDFHNRHPQHADNLAPPPGHEEVDLPESAQPAAPQ
jgi:hypothetical protein